MLGSLERARTKHPADVGLEHLLASRLQSCTPWIRLLLTATQSSAEEAHDQVASGEFDIVSKSLVTQAQRILRYIVNHLVASPFHILVSFLSLTFMQLVLQHFLD